MSKFDKVVRFDTEKKNELKQCVEDLPAATEDCNKMRECLKEYGITGVDKEYWLGNNPSEADVKDAIRSLSKLVIEGKSK